ncbi:MAG: hypothetical protein K2F89_08330, partial [Treponemataceae bacterium]|nr:hypothetical protein [Treponemataceae bacterium]
MELLTTLFFADEAFLSAATFLTEAVVFVADFVSAFFSEGFFSAATFFAEEAFLSVAKFLV